MENNILLEAVTRGAKMSVPLFTQISADLMSYEKEFGSGATIEHYSKFDTID